jgi:transcriptional regulator with XRE-family HTH domain
MENLISPLKLRRMSILRTQRIEGFEALFSSLREQKNLTQQDLANALGVSLRTVEDWENGLAEAELDDVQAKKLYKVLGITLKQLINKYGLNVSYESCPAHNRRSTDNGSKSSWS